MLQSLRTWYIIYYIKILTKNLEILLWKIQMYGKKQEKK